MENIEATSKKINLNTLLIILIVILTGAVVYLALRPGSSAVRTGAEKEKAAMVEQTEETSVGDTAPINNVDTTESAPADDEAASEEPTQLSANYKDDIDADINSMDSLDLNGPADGYSDDELGDL